MHTTTDTQHKPGDPFDLPRSDATVKLRAIDTTTAMACDASAFVQPLIANHSKLNFKTMCFLLEHETDSGIESVLFDCGSRKDFWNGSPMTQSMIGGHVPAVKVEYGVDEILTSKGFRMDTLKAIIWSHWHWDHIGDGSKFPGHADIVVGPGFTDAFLPGWPENPDSFVLAEDVKGHTVHEPDFLMSVAGFAAHDYFNDGSFYLLDVPGHAVGHICGLARTTPDTFVFLGGDCCHFAGMFRPSPSVPLPVILEDVGLDSYYPPSCPCSLFTAYHPGPEPKDDSQQDGRRTSPFYRVSETEGSAYQDAQSAQTSITKLQALDAHPGVFICLAHDTILFNVLPLYNHAPLETLNDWRTRGYKEMSRWSFLNDLPKGSQPGREPFVVGKWRDGLEVTWGKDSGFVPMYNRKDSIAGV